MNQIGNNDHAIFCQSPGTKKEDTQKPPTLDMDNSTPYIVTRWKKVGQRPSPAIYITPHGKAFTDKHNFTSPLVRKKQIFGACFLSLLLFSIFFFVTQKSTILGTMYSPQPGLQDIAPCSLPRIVAKEYHLSPQSKVRTAVFDIDGVERDLTWHRGCTWKNDDLTLLSLILTLKKPLDAKSHDLVPAGANSSMIGHYRASVFSGNNFAECLVFGPVGSSTVYVVAIKTFHTLPKDTFSQKICSVATHFIQHRLR